jgi:DNA-binding MarR family transcriptional regulator
MKTSQPIHYVRIPSRVCFDTRLSASAKLLYGEIAHLCEQQGSCPMSNHYFAGLYQVTTKTVTAWVDQLEAAGYLRIRYDASGQHRLLYLEATVQETPDTNPNQLSLLP